MSGNNVQIIERNNDKIVFSVPKDAFSLNFIKILKNYPIEINKEGIFKLESDAMTSFLLEIEKSIQYGILDPNHILVERKEIALRPYQEADVNKYISSRKICDFSEPGTGKTAKIVEGIQRVNAPLSLIVVPASLLTQWKHEIIKFWHSRDQPTILINTVYDNCVEEGNVILLCSYEYIRRNIKDFLKCSYTILACDEANKIKSVNSWGNCASKVGLAIQDLAEKSFFVWLLTGTPYVSRVKDLWPLFKITNNAFCNDFIEFTQRFCGRRKIYCGSRSFHYIDGATNLPELNKIIGETCIRRYKKDVFKNEKIRQQVYISVSGIFEPDSTLEGAALLAEFQRKREALALAKVSGVCSFVKTILERDKKLIVFCTYRAEVEAIAPKLGNKAIWIHGGKNVRERDSAIQEFITNKEPVALIASLAVASTGLNLCVADTVVFASLSFCYTDHLQAEGRVHRIGLNGQANIYYLLSDNCLFEKRLYKIVNRKFVESSVILDGAKKNEDFLHEQKSVEKELISIYKGEKV